MTGGACDGCLRASVALAAVGGVLEVLPVRRRPRGLLSLEPEQLLSIADASGHRALRIALDGFDGEAERARIRSTGILSACAHRGDFPWPSVLLGDPDPPRVLNVLGDPSLLESDLPAVAIVGSRRPDPSGARAARGIGRSVASAGAAVISGMAMGIDAAAHEGALEAREGMTVAVVAGGVDRVYPRSNERLHARIVERGCVVSEMPPGAPVWKWSFPARNRLIAAFAQLVVVVQAAERSGSLHTADAAIARNRLLAAVPGPIDMDVSRGSNRLIADGAMVVTAVGDALEFVGLTPGPDADAVPEGLSEAWQLVAGGGAELESRLAAEGGAVLRRQLAELELLGAVVRDALGGWRTAGTGG